MSERASTVVLGIDPGPRNTGWALLEFYGGGERLLDAGKWTSVSNVVTDQIVEMGAAFDALLMPDARPWVPNLIGIEAWTYQRPLGRNAQMLSQSLNTTTVPRVIERMATLAGIRGIPVLEIKTQFAKASVGLTGRCPKSRIKRATEALFPDAVLPNQHVRDAVLVAYAAMRKWRIDQFKLQRRRP